MNTQIEHLDNHTARLTVEVTQERVDKAMRDAARRISNQVAIPGFRKGKAPYNLVLQRFGAEAVLNEAIEQIGNAVYKEALDETHLEPYAPGSLENIETEPNVKLVFVVPKQPEVELGAYRDIRLPFESEEVSDEMVNKAMAGLQERRALVETAERPAQVGDLVKVKVTATITHPASEGHDHEHTDEEKAAIDAVDPKIDPAEVEAEVKAEGTSETAAETPAETEGEGEEHAHDEHGHTEPYMDDEVEVTLREDEKDDDVMPGFSRNLVGMSVGEEKSFEIAFPADHPEKGLAGHSFNFQVKVNEVKSRTLPALNDDFAKQVSNGEIDNLLSLRMDVRRQLEEASKRETESKYADQVLEKIVEQATVKYPEEMVEQYTDDILQSLDRNLKERGLSLEDYKRVENKDDAALRQDYRDTAIKRLQRALVLGEVVKREQLDVSDADVAKQIDKMSAQFGAQADVFRQMLMRDESRSGIAMDLITNRALERIVAIGRGENPPVGPTPEPPAAETPSIILPSGGESSSLASGPEGAAAQESPVAAEPAEPTETTESAAPQAESAQSQPSEPAAQSDQGPQGEQTEQQS